MRVPVLPLFLFCAAALHGADFRVGVGRKPIAPEHRPVWLSGYAARTTPATGTVHQVWAKALVFEEAPTNRFALITAEVLGLSREITEDVAARLRSRYGLPRAQVLFNSSHTHAGPYVWPCLGVCQDLSPEDQRGAIAYDRQLADALVEVVGMALTNLAPARVTAGRGSAEFAANRRRPPVKPVDHDVPVVRIAAPDGAVRAVLFGYACHNTTLPAANLMVCGDYAGFAQAELEQAYPGATALFLQGCAADQNPSPRGTMEIARQHGRALADAVRQVLSNAMRPVRAPLHTAFTETQLEFSPFQEEPYRKDLLGADVFKKRRAQLMLEQFRTGHVIRTFPYPVQAVRFGDDLTLLAMSGETVVDYALRAKREFSGENLIMAGYCNAVQCYIPSRRILQEGGYEANDSMIYYGLPGPFTNSVEDTVFSAVRLVMRQVGARAAD